MLITKKRQNRKLSSEGCTAPSSRGETRDPEVSEGRTAPSSNGETNDPEDPDGFSSEIILFLVGFPFFFSLLYFVDALFRSTQCRFFRQQAQRFFLNNPILTANRVPENDRLSGARGRCHGELQLLSRRSHGERSRSCSRNASIQKILMGSHLSSNCPWSVSRNVCLSVPLSSTQFGFQVTGMALLPEQPGSHREQRS